MYSGEGIYTIIQNQIASITSRGSTSDIYRGELYRALRVGSNYVTLILNTDGIPVFKSSKYEFWPVYLLINELPFKMRSVGQLSKPMFLCKLCAYRVSKENRILTGLWYGSLNPDMSLFLRPVVESLKKLHTDGNLL